ncbi:hypothetical protein [Actinophytocola oryzae]|uniref:Uncharacterized protein n=1 Tax=Actinophytocola oryzae TaxID=502181 RepID=A0A4R7VQY4_9PSEU|nr:hypothetical protein [Actinophytocola oryzae]TDV52052.1 hypothetical protein CLV71_105183 [Actinophytocola oryzae]
MTTTTKTRGSVRSLLWVVLVLSVAGNVALQGMIIASVCCGVVALASGATLVVDHYRHR